MGRFLVGDELVPGFRDTISGKNCQAELAGFDVSQGMIEIMPHLAYVFWECQSILLQPVISESEFLSS